MKKILIIAVIVLVVGGIVAFSVLKSSSNASVVQTGNVVKRELATIVSASGEIKPKTYVNVGANAFGKITHLYVREGDKVKAGQLLAQLENVQSAADVAAQKATVGANQTDAAAADAALRTANADLKRARADAEKSKQDYDRAEGLYNAQLIAKADYDARKAANDIAIAQLAQAEARVAQSQ